MTSPDSKSPRGDAVLRILDGAVVAVGLFFALQLVVSQVDFNVGPVRFRSSRAVRPAVLLAGLWVAKYVRVLRRTGGGPPSLHTELKRDISRVVALASLTMFFHLRNHQVVNLYTPAEQQNAMLTGDEPSYMLIAQSLVLDRDVNLYNDARERGGSTFHCAGAAPHKALVDHSRQVMYSIHPVGLPAFVAPVFGLALRSGITARYAVSTLLALLATGYVVLTYVLARRLTGSGWASATAAVLTAASLPLLVASYQVYPDLCGGLLALVGIVILVARPAGQPGVAGAVVVGLCMALLPWLHIRYAVLSAALFIGVVSVWRRSPSRLALSCLPPAVSALALMYSYQRWFGSPWPNAPYVAQGTDSHLHASLTELWQHALGVLVDSGMGLLPWAPLFVFVPVGIWYGMCRCRLPNLLLLAICLPYATLISSFALWWGGFSTPCRFLVPLLPYLAVWLAFFLKDNRRALPALLFVAFAALSVYFAHRAAYGNYALLYAKKHILETMPIGPSDRFVLHAMPRLLRMEGSPLRLGFLYMGLIALLNAYCAMPGGTARRCCAVPPGSK